MCLLPWQQWLKHQPISMVRRRGCSSFQRRHSRVYSGETSCNTSAAMTGKLLFALFTGRGDRSVSEGCAKLHEKNTVLRFPGTQQKRGPFCLGSRTFMCVWRGCRAPESFPRPKLWEARVLARRYICSHKWRPCLRGWISSVNIVGWVVESWVVFVCEEDNSAPLCVFLCVRKLVFAGLLEVSSHPGLTLMWQSTHNGSHGLSAWITSKDERRVGKKLWWKCRRLPQQVFFLSAGCSLCFQSSLCWLIITRL